MKTHSKILITSALAGVFLSGCFTTTLQTNSTMTQSIFIDPVAKEKRVIFLNIKNTSGKEIYLENRLRAELIGKGYTITDDPDMATYILSTNVLYVDRKQENNALGGAAAGAAIGSGISAYNSNGALGVIGSGAAGALVGGLFGKMSEDTIWQMQVDINIKQRAQGGALSANSTASGQASVSNSTRSGFLNSFGGSVRGNQAGRLNSNTINQSSQLYESAYIEKNTIIFAEAAKSGLELSEATPILEDKIAKQIAGLF